MQFQTLFFGVSIEKRPISCVPSAIVEEFGHSFYFGQKKTQQLLLPLLSTQNFIILTPNHYQINEDLLHLQLLIKFWQCYGE